MLVLTERMRRRFRISSVAVLVVLQLTFSTGATCGLMLCVEPDGRGGIESVFSRDCCAEAQAEFAADRIACDCTDIPLLTSAATVVGSSRGPIVPGVAPLPVQRALRAPSRKEHRVPLVSELGRDFGVAGRRSVVLVV